MAAPRTAQPESLGTFRIVGKYIHRASIVPLKMGERADGTPNIVNQPGPMELLAVGTEVDDVQEHELLAFPDRFEAVDETARKTVLRLRGLDPDETPADVPPPPPQMGTPSAPSDKGDPPQPVEPTQAEKDRAAAEQERARQTRGTPAAPGTTPTPTHPVTPTPSEPAAHPPAAEEAPARRRP
jgi:hypothetical protein